MNTTEELATTTTTTTTTGLALTYNQRLRILPSKTHTPSQQPSHSLLQRQPIPHYQSRERDSLRQHKKKKKKKKKYIYIYTFSQQSKGDRHYNKTRLTEERSCQSIHSHPPSLPPPPPPPRQPCVPLINSPIITHFPWVWGSITFLSHPSPSPSHPPSPLSPPSLIASTRRRKK